MTFASFRYLLWIVILIVTLAFCISDEKGNKSSEVKKYKRLR